MGKTDLSHLLINVSNSYETQPELPNSNEYKGRLKPKPSGFIEEKIKEPPLRDDKLFIRIKDPIQTRKEEEEPEQEQ